VTEEIIRIYNVHFEKVSNISNTEVEYCTQYTLLARPKHIWDSKKWHSAALLSATSHFTALLEYLYDHPPKHRLQSFHVSQQRKKVLCAVKLKVLRVNATYCTFYFHKSTH